MLAAVPSPASAEANHASAPQFSRGVVDGVDEFYRARDGRPLWFESPEGSGAQALQTLLASAELDGLNRDEFLSRPLLRALRAAWSGSPSAVARADRQLSLAFVNYVTALRGPRDPEWQVVDAAAAPGVPVPALLLRQVAESGSVADFVSKMGFMHPQYHELRQRLAESPDAAEAGRLALNMRRLSFLPSGTGRYVLVNAAAQRLYMYENGQVVDAMKVVVGKPEQPTPVLAATIRYAALNPYWNLPPDLVAERVAPHVVKGGVGYLHSQGYEILSDWTKDATIVDPKTIDWEAVQAGKVELRMRQKPGPGNAMGRMKFMFPNPQGVYLHDTPNKELLAEEARLFSAGCVRLEDAQRLGKWLYGKPLKTATAKPEQDVPLQPAVPVYLAYLTAETTDGQVVFYDDIYGRDRQQISAGAVSARTAR